MYSHEIEYVVTKDGTKYQFDGSAIIANDTIVWAMKLVEMPKLYEQVSIPLSDVAQVGESNPETTDSVDTKTGAKYVFIKRPPTTEYVVTKTGAKYVFKAPPTVVNKAVVGEAKIVESEKMSVSIPLSEVAQLGPEGSVTIEYVVTKTGAKYLFDDPPTVVNKTVTGVGRLVEAPKQARVSIPLSDVKAVCVSESNTIGNYLLAAGILAVAALAVVGWICGNIGS